MGRRHNLIVFSALVVLAGAACGDGSPSSTARAAASSYEQYAVESCAAWDALFRAVGNPDTASGSDLSRALDEAVERGDAASAERLATDIARELTAGREHIAVASGWQPRAQVTAQMDRMFAAYEAMIAAKLAAAGRDPNALAPQTAFEQAGGVEAYFAWIEALRVAVEGNAGAAGQCPNLPVPP